MSIERSLPFPEEIPMKAFYLYQMPCSSGVYRLAWKRDSEYFAYVGSAMNLRVRIFTHFQGPFARFMTVSKTRVTIEAWVLPNNFWFATQRGFTAKIRPIEEYWIKESNEKGFVMMNVQYNHAMDSRLKDPEFITF